MRQGADTCSLKKEKEKFHFTLKFAQDQMKGFNRQFHSINKTLEGNETKGEGRASLRELMPVLGQLGI